MEIVYVFIGRLPSYTVETIQQSRKWSDGKITLLCDDIQSPYLPQLAQYNVNIQYATEYTDLDFDRVANENFTKFCIADKLGDRRLLFIRSFERFFILKNYMRDNNLENILFLELDMMIYFNPCEMLPLFSQKELTLAYNQEAHVSSALAYIRSPEILDDINQYFIQYIKNAKKDEFISEMRGLSLWLQNPENKKRVWMLPGLWKDERYVSDIWKEFETFNRTLFDSAAGFGVLVDGPDQVHREEWERNGRGKWNGVDVDYSEYRYEWKMEENKRVMYLLDKQNNPFKVQCIHVHSKNLHVCLS
jgi:hypothetical protein